MPFATTLGATDCATDWSYLTLVRIVFLEPRILRAQRARLGQWRRLHKTTYYDHRAMTGLPSQLVCAARVKVTEALQLAKSLKS